MRRTLLLLVAALLVAPAASAQMGGMGAGAGAGGRGQAGPTQSGPTQNRQVGPRAGAAGGDDETQVTQRAEPVIAPPADPLAITPELRARMGSDYQSGPPTPVGETHRKYLPYYEESRGDYRFRFLPPLWLEYTRGLPAARSMPGEPTHEDRQSLFGLLYYQRRSAEHDADVLFPAFWHLRDGDNRVTVVGPLVHREASDANDNWLAPLYFEGKRKDGGYFHSLALLTTSHWNTKSAFTWSGLFYFRDRTDTDVDWGIAPFFFHGDNGNVEGARRTYSLAPLLLTYHQAHEIDSTSTTLVGPVLAQSTPKRDVLDVLPLFYSIHGKPESGGIKETHTTFFPFFHYGKTDDESLFVLPGYLRRVTKTADTLLTPLVSHIETRGGAAQTTIAGPILPIYYRHTDRDTGASASMVAPFYYASSGPTGSTFLSPLAARFETHGESRTWWIFPNITTTNDTHGWDVDVHPLVYMGRTDDASHTVIAPVFWDFANPKGRTTIAAPLFWRFADATDNSILQVAGNTLYRQKQVENGLAWEFHVLPVFSYGANPQGYWWNVLFGLAGYDREGSYARIKALYIPITVAGGGGQAQAASR